MGFEDCGTLTTICGVVYMVFKNVSEETDLEFFFEK